MRYRYIGLIGGSAAVLGALLWTDPDSNVLTTRMMLLALVSPIVAIALAHVYRKVLHDYPEADMQVLFRKAGESPIGAGLALIALSMVLSALLGLFSPRAHAQEVHRQALALAPTLNAEIDAHWPTVPRRAYVPALISHESCITYTHSRCWSPTSRLKTQREEGAGLGQLTRAWRADGSLRFDALSEMRERHPALRELNWSTIYEQPELQIRALILKSRDNFTTLRMVNDTLQRLAMADAAYNGGIDGVLTERRACGMTDNCDPQQWWGNVERVCLKSKAPLYGNRSACDINRHHVKDVWLRMDRYKGIVGEKT